MKKMADGRVRIRIGMAVCLLLGVFSTGSFAQQDRDPSHTPEELKNLYARSAVLMDGDNGRVLFGKNETEMLPMASTTKIMTCILALEQSDLRELCAVSENAASQPQVRLGIKSGETYRLEDLLYSLMLESHNDSAVCIAEHISGSVENFAKQMNRKAEEIGCIQTHFVTPNGLDGEDAGGEHRISAADLAQIMRYCIAVSEKREEFLNITRTLQYSFQDVSGKRSFSCTNHNALLTAMEGALSGKTGFTGKAGYCYVGAVRRGEKTLIVALLACGWPGNRSYKWADTRKLVEYGFSNYEKKVLEIETVPLPKVNVLQGEKQQASLEVKYRSETMLPENVSAAGKTEPPRFEVLLKKEEKLQVKLQVLPFLRAPFAKGQTAGCLQILVDHQILQTYPLVTREAVQKKTYLFCLGHIWERFLLGMGSKSDEAVLVISHSIYESYITKA